MLDNTFFAKIPDKSSRDGFIVNDLSSLLRRDEVAKVIKTWQCLSGFLCLIFRLFHAILLKLGQPVSREALVRQKKGAIGLPRFLFGFVL